MAKLNEEVIVNGKHVNSQTLKLPSGKTLKDKERQEFEIHRIKTDVLIAEMIENQKFQARKDWKIGREDGLKICKI